jgi:hypothetical protein
MKGRLKQVVIVSFLFSILTADEPDQTGCHRGHDSPRPPPAGTPPLTSFVSLWARRPNQPLRRSNRGKLETDSTHYRPVTCCRHTLL